MTGGVLLLGLNCVNVEAVMTDGHSNYEGIDDFTRFDVRHLRCHAQFVKAKVIRLRKLKEICQRRRYSGLVRILEGLDAVLRDLSPPQGPTLQDLFQRVLPYKLSYSRRVAADSGSHATIAIATLLGRHSVNFWMASPISCFIG